MKIRLTFGCFGVILGRTFGRDFDDGRDGTDLEDVTNFVGNDFEGLIAFLCKFIEPARCLVVVA